MIRKRYLKMSMYLTMMRLIYLKVKIPWIKILLVSTVMSLELQTSINQAVKQIAPNLLIIFQRWDTVINLFQTQEIKDIKKTSHYNLNPQITKPRPKMALMQLNEAFKITEQLMIQFDP